MERENSILKLLSEQLDHQALLQLSGGASASANPAASAGLSSYPNDLVMSDCNDNPYDGGDPTCDDSIA